MQQCAGSRRLYGAKGHSKVHAKFRVSFDTISALPLHVTMAVGLFSSFPAAGVNSSGGVSGNGFDMLLLLCTRLLVRGLTISNPCCLHRQQPLTPTPSCQQTCSSSCDHIKRPHQHMGVTLCGPRSCRTPCSTGSGPTSTSSRAAAPPAYQQCAGKAAAARTAAAKAAVQAAGGS